MVQGGGTVERDISDDTMTGNNNKTQQSNITCESGKDSDNSTNNDNDISDSGDNGGTKISL